MKRMFDVFRAGPPWFRHALEAMTPYAGVDWTQGSDCNFADDGRTVVAHTAAAEVLGSRSHADDPVRNEHVIVLDLDQSQCCHHFVESSSPGNHHLYFETAAPWDSVVKLLKALEECEILQPGYVAAALERRELMVRPPWVRKTHEKADAQRALMDWIDGEKPSAGAQVSSPRRPPLAQNAETSSGRNRT